MKQKIQESAEVLVCLKEQAGLIADIARFLADTVRKGNKILVCGNGGSAADAQHFAAEIVGRYKMERPGYPAIALTTDTSILTAVANDYGFDRIFERQLEALGRSGDVLVAISTSGNSPNILKAADKALALDMYTISLTGKGGGELASRSCYNLDIKSPNTPNIQESHEVVLHILAGLLEELLSA
ncbi:D-sedoheptulose 7-phosphate isomerase [bacterium]|nr:D-sedoheptulose 7-phosphate isomerase [bacterium]